MGADLILAYAEVPEPFTDDTVGKLRALAANPPNLLFDMVVDRLEYDDEADSRADVTDRLRTAVDVVFVEYYHRGGMHRELVTIAIRDREYIFTGGMSWGDLPSDVYEDVCMAAMLSEMLIKRDEQSGS